LTTIGLHGVTAQETELFTTTNVRTSNPTCKVWIIMRDYRRIYVLKYVKAWTMKEISKMRT
jgi:hypothetical protein